ncbi:uncharacterized protein LOC18437972 isoform X2 [Amborella trichopoda]|uniref:uncharacterized protein LOC18437972 isoform X2 n=1 Tax=Amborella trichopoda TaxID=13333 RepID=UPI0005D376AD|nr:uncharacterized protein LOC18437972 isoform X2 [Amborella trichopoda]|eukprot:XP_011624771.1 uncharacterized protein LOC18437972 isoform X2 [Amborella trichopoda]
MLRGWWRRAKSARWVTLYLALANISALALAAILLFLLPTNTAAEEEECLFSSYGPPFVLVAMLAAVRILAIVGTAAAQEATAVTILTCSHPQQQLDTDNGGGGIGAAYLGEATVVRRDRRMRYKRWLWWTRLGMVITVMQFLAAVYLMFVAVRNTSSSFNGNSITSCFSAEEAHRTSWKRVLVFVFLIHACLLVAVQCCTGSDVLRWRSFYATHDTAWKAHYREVFDHGIREALCCLGRVKYLSVLEEDEIDSVARLLGDLVAYRATGTGHLELLAGLALLQRQRESLPSFDGLPQAPEARVQEAAMFHQFAEAAYTGPLLDFGRNPILFPCAWLHRQGILTPWTFTRRPILQGDNWWRGHAAAFLKYVNLPPEALRGGRVSQTKCEAAYFVVVLHHVKCVVIVVRGTETPEDLITDGLCTECTLSAEELDGLLTSNALAADVKQHVLSSFPHYGHSGIVEAARELYMQIDGETGDNDHKSEADNDSKFKMNSFLYSLLGPGCECQGYNIRIVGHSLGGAIGALLGLRLYKHYPNLHVYSYGTLPCVDRIIAEACSDFVTSIVYNDEFSARLSVSSILRLQSAAIAALAQGSSANSATICKLARHLMCANKCQTDHVPPLHSNAMTGDDGSQIFRRGHYKSMIKGSEPDETVLYQEATSYIDDQDFVKTDNSEEYNTDSGPDMMRTCVEPCTERDTETLDYGNNSSHFLFLESSLSSDGSLRDPREMFLPGLVIHIVPELREMNFPLWKSWKSHDRETNYRAFLADRESFKDIIVSPYMFLDHLPWRCHYAMQRVLETRRARGQLESDLLNQSHIV